jgi:hypothetical protein
MRIISVSTSLDSRMALTSKKHAPCLAQRQLWYAFMNPLKKVACKRRNGICGGVRAAYTPTYNPSLLLACGFFSALIHFHNQKKAVHDAPPFVGREPLTARLQPPGKCLKWYPRLRDLHPLQFVLPQRLNLRIDPVWELRQASGRKRPQAHHN